MFAGGAMLAAEWQRGIQKHRGNGLDVGVDGGSRALRYLQELAGPLDAIVRGGVVGPADLGAQADLEKAGLVEQAAQREN